MKTMHIFLSS